MHTILNNEWDQTDITQLTLRKIKFEQDAPQRTVAWLLGQAWKHLPPTPDSADVENDFMRKYSSDMTMEEWEERMDIPVNPDTETIHTPWRDKIYYLWNHLFYDVSNFLNRMYDNAGHLHPPASDVFGLPFPRMHSTDEERDNIRVLTKTFDTEVLLIPTYLAPGVAVRVETFSPGEEGGVVRNVQKMRGRFETLRQMEVWYIQKGVEGRFYVEGDWEKDSKGLAAVMVYGKLCDETHGGGGDYDGDDDGKEEE
ncbi:hypothetical protein MPDQ_005674 [Monascus purpureus]|uniref:Uncharacterized protein n=1 Tax=Monascus purpureus TaxID=5098 RepID=A0A507QYA2_MONPU|nr:hypothetical protein MPDQ_005674 [Monascus purpureus]